MGKLATFFLILAAGAPAADLNLLNLVMPDARVVSGINVVRARDSSFGQFLMGRASAHAESPEFQDFIQKTGFDPRQDLTQVLFATPGGAENQRKLLLALGRFDPLAIRRAAEGAGAQVSTYKGIDVISGPEGHRPQGGPMSLAFLDSSLAVAGDTDSVRRAIDRNQGGPGGPSATLADKANQLSSTQDAWLVSLVPASEFASHFGIAEQNPMIRADALKTIQQVSGGIKFGDLVKLSATLVTQTTQDASSLADVLRFLAGLVQLQNQPGLGPVQSLLQ
jgi:hypothetical protein